MGQADTNNLVTGVFSPSRLLREYCGSRVSDEELAKSADLLSNQLMRLLELLPPRRDVQERQDHREQFTLDYDRQRTIVWAFANGIASVYQAVTRIGIHRCLDRETSVQFSKLMMDGLAEISAAAWISATEDLALVPLMEYDGVTKGFGRLEVQSAIVSTLEPQFKLLELIALSSAARSLERKLKPDPMDEAATQQPTVDELSSTAGSAAGVSVDEAELASGTKSKNASAYRGLKHLSELEPCWRARAERRRQKVVPIMQHERKTIYSLAKDCDFDRNTLVNFLNGKTTTMSEAKREVLASKLSLIAKDLPE
jgi:hypothetical protein